MRSIEEDMAFYIDYVQRRIHDLFVARLFLETVTIFATHVATEMSFALFIILPLVHMKPDDWHG